MIDRGRVGFATAPTTVRVDAWRVKLFCQAIGETDPVYWDAATARAAGHPACPMPATFLKALESEHIDGIALLELLGAPSHAALHAGQAFEFHAPLHVGDEVAIARRIVDIHDKKNGALTFIVADTEYRAHGRLAATSRQTFVIRNKVIPA